jgi:integrase
MASRALPLDRGRPMVPRPYIAKDGRWHGRVTVGTRDDGSPDRRHTSAKTEAEVVRKVRALERGRDSGAVRKVGQRWTVATWLTH